MPGLALVPLASARQAAQSFVAGIFRSLQSATHAPSPSPMPVPLPASPLAPQRSGLHAQPSSASSNAFFPFGSAFEQHDTQSILDTPAHPPSPMGASSVDPSPGTMTSFDETSAEASTPVSATC